MNSARCEVLEADATTPWPAVLRMPDGRTLRVYSETAPPHARWLGMSEGVPLWAEPCAETLPSTGTFREIDLGEAVDEVGVGLGPDRDVVGLFDAPAEPSMTGERTAIPGVAPAVEQRRTSLLAWIAAGTGESAPVAETTDACTPLRRTIADEPPDVVPSLSAPSAARSATLSLRNPPASQADAGPEDTATDLPAMARAAPTPAENSASGSSSADGATSPALTDAAGARTHAPTGERILRLARAVALILLGTSALAWWYLG